MPGGTRSTGGRPAAPDSAASRSATVGTVDAEVMRRPRTSRRAGSAYAEQPAGHGTQGVRDRHPHGQPGTREIVRGHADPHRIDVRPDRERAHGGEVHQVGADRAGDVVHGTVRESRGAMRRHARGRRLLQRLVGQQPIRGRCPSFRRPDPACRRPGGAAAPSPRRRRRVRRAIRAAATDPTATRRRRAASAAAAASARSPVALVRYATSSRLNRNAMRAKGSSAPGELRLAGPLPDEGRHADARVVGGEQLGEPYRASSSSPVSREVSIPSSMTRFAATSAAVGPAAKRRANVSASGRTCAAGTATVARPERDRLGAAHAAAREDQLLGLRGPDQPGEPLRAAGTRDHAKGDLRQPEHGVLGRERGNRPPTRVRTRRRGRSR